MSPSDVYTGCLVATGALLGNCSLADPEPALPDTQCVQQSSDGSSHKGALVALLLARVLPKNVLADTVQAASIYIAST